MGKLKLEQGTVEKAEKEATEGKAGELSQNECLKGLECPSWVETTHLEEG